MKKNLILGLGATGKSLIEYLNNKKEILEAFDTREYIKDLNAFKKQFPGIAFHQGNFYEDYIKNANVVYVSPGVSLHKDPLKTYLKKYKPSISSDIDLFCQKTNKPIIAITGSNGKSTTTTMIGNILKEHNLKVGIGGNLGFPVLNFLNDNKKYDVFVLELSSFQLETSFSLKNHIGICLNISDDHLDRYQNIDHYRQTKFQIFEKAKYKILFHNELINYSNINCIFGKDSNKYDYITIDKSYCLRAQILNQKYSHLCKNSFSKIKAKHNLLNIEASIAASIYFLKEKFDINKTLKAIENFQNLPHRSQIIAIKKGITYINDSKATNVGSAISSIDSFKSQKNTLWVILGGIGKDANFYPLKESLIKANAKAILIGQDANIIAKSIGEENIAFFANGFDDIFLKLKAKYGDTVLLAPACASFDMFESFEDRGNKFIKKVNEIV